jgi:hypothetical protein
MDAKLLSPPQGFGFAVRTLNKAAADPIVLSEFVVSVFDPRSSRIQCTKTFQEVGSHLKYIDF